MAGSGRGKSLLNAIPSVVRRNRDAGSTPSFTMYKGEARAQITAEIGSDRYRQQERDAETYGAL
jgi:hypothetical protein